MQAQLIQILRILAVVGARLIFRLVILWRLKGYSYNTLDGDQPGTEWYGESKDPYYAYRYIEQD